MLNIGFENYIYFFLLLHILEKDEGICGKYYQKVQIGKLIDFGSCQHVNHRCGRRRRNHFFCCFFLFKQSMMSKEIVFFFFFFFL